MYRRPMDARVMLLFQYSLGRGTSGTEAWRSVPLIYLISRCRECAFDANEEIC